MEIQNVIYSLIHRNIQSRYSGKETVKKKEVVGFICASHGVPKKFAPLFMRELEILGYIERVNLIYIKIIPSDKKDLEFSKIARRLELW